jgi:hypothetical protein
MKARTKKHIAEKPHMLREPTRPINKSTFQFPPTPKISCSRALRTNIQNGAMVFFMHKKYTEQTVKQKNAM